jgi:hypothetical protein
MGRGVAWFLKARCALCAGRVAASPRREGTMENAAAAPERRRL